jgi:hypothetical protein
MYKKKYKGGDMSVLLAASYSGTKACAIFVKGWQQMFNLRTDKPGSYPKYL